MARYLCLLALALGSAESFAILPQKLTKSLFKPLFSATSPIASSINENLQSALKKSSKTLAVAIEYDSPLEGSTTDGDLTTLSMQLRKLKAAALVTSNLAAATAFVVEQATAQGNFPGPCPVIYNGKDVEAAVQAGVSAVIIDDADQSELDSVEVIHKVSSVEEVNRIAGRSGAFLVDAHGDDVVEIVQAIPTGSIVIASLKAMQIDNAEIEVGKNLKGLGVTTVLVEKACVGDKEDIQYSTFVIDGMTKKKSSTFNMSGLTGSTNGHFGGVASSTSQTWLRMKQLDDSCAELT